MFTIAGPVGQDRVKPLNNRHIILQIVQVAEESSTGFDRTHNNIPLVSMMNIRSTYYAYPAYPAEVSVAVSWLRSKADQLPKEPEVAPRQTNTKQARLSKQLKTPSTTEPNTTPDAVVPTEVNTVIECSVCAERFGEGTNPHPSRSPTVSCSHPADVCASCLSQTIAAHMEMRGVAIPVPCPNVACLSTLSNDDVRQWSSEDTFARWDMLSLREQMRKDKSGGGLFVWCQSPDCYSGQLHVEGGT